MKVLINIDPEIEDEIIVKSLKWARQDLSETKRLMFSNNRKTDRRLIKEHIKALDLIIGYYSVET